MNKQKIPDTDSIQELAHFWDTHDLTDFEDELEEVTELVFERKRIFKIYFQPDEAEAVMQLARSKGISCAELIRRWILERVES